MLMLSRFGPIVSQHQTVRMFVMIISAGYRNDHDHHGPMLLFVLLTCIDSYSTLFFCIHDSKALLSTVSSVYVIVKVIKQANELGGSEFFFNIQKFESLPSDYSRALSFEMTNSWSLPGTCGQCSREGDGEMWGVNSKTNYLCSPMHS